MPRAFRGRFEPLDHFVVGHLRDLGPLCPWVAARREDGFVQNKGQALLDVNFYNVCDDQEGKIMFERLITAIIMVVAVAIVASGLPLSSISGAGSGALGFFNLSPIF